MCDWEGAMVTEWVHAFLCRGWWQSNSCSCSYMVYGMRKRWGSEWCRNGGPTSGWMVAIENRIIVENLDFPIGRTGPGIQSSGRGWSIYILTCLSRRWGPLRWVSALQETGLTGPDLFIKCCLRWSAGASSSPSAALASGQVDGCGGVIGVIEDIDVSLWWMIYRDSDRWYPRLLFQKNPEL